MIVLQGGRSANMADAASSELIGNLQNIDAGLAFFLVFGGAAVLTVVWQISSLCRTIMNPEESTSEETTPDVKPAAALLPRATSKEKIAQKSESSKKLVTPPMDLESGRAATFGGKKSKGKPASKSKLATRPIERAGYEAGECASP